MTVFVVLGKSKAMEVESKKFLVVFKSVKKDGNFYLKLVFDKIDFFFIVLTQNQKQITVITCNFHQMFVLTN